MKSALILAAAAAVISPATATLFSSTLACMVNAQRGNFGLTPVKTRESDFKELQAEAWKMSSTKRIIPGSSGNGWRKIPVKFECPYGHEYDGTNEVSVVNVINNVTQSVDTLNAPNITAVSCSAHKEVGNHHCWGMVKIYYTQVDGLTSPSNCTNPIPPGLPTPPGGGSYEPPSSTSDLPSASSGYQNPDTGYENPGTGNQTPDTGYQNPSTGNQTPDTGYENPNTGTQPSDTGYTQPSDTGYNQTPDTGYQNPSTDNQTPDTGYQNPSTDNQTPDTGYQNPSTDNQTPDTGYNNPDTGNVDADSESSSSNAPPAASSACAEEQSY